MYQQRNAISRRRVCVNMYSVAVAKNVLTNMAHSRNEKESRQRKRGVKNKSEENKRKIKPQ